MGLIPGSMLHNARHRKTLLTKFAIGCLVLAFACASPVPLGDSTTGESALRTMLNGSLSEKQSPERQASTHVLISAIEKAQNNPQDRSVFTSLGQAKSLDPANPLVYFSYGWIYSMQGDCTQGQSYFLHSFSRGLDVASDWKGLSEDAQKECRRKKN